MGGGYPDPINSTIRPSLFYYVLSPSRSTEELSNYNCQKGGVDIEQSQPSNLLGEAAKPTQDHITWRKSTFMMRTKGVKILFLCIHQVQVYSHLTKYAVIIAVLYINFIQAAT